MDSDRGVPLNERTHCGNTEQATLWTTVSSILREESVRSESRNKDDTRCYAEVDEDFTLYLGAAERMSWDDGTRKTLSEVFGSGYRPMGDRFKLEFN